MRRLCVLVGLAAGVAAIVAVSASASPASRAPRIKGFSMSESTNWSGYAATGAAPFSDVNGSWTEPAVTCSATSASSGAKLVHAKGNGHGGGPGGGKPSKSQNSYASFWVGLDGDLSNTVEQIGTDSDCAGSTPVYYAWYEFYPAAPVNLPSSYPVAPGDTLSGEVSVSSPNGKVMVTVQLTSSQGWKFTASTSDNGYALSSAEWIAEAPSSGSVLPLADFGTVAFDNASATDASTKGSISAFTNDAITMVTKFGQPKAIPGGLTSNGSSFSVTWQHS